MVVCNSHASPKFMKGHNLMQGIMHYDVLWVMILCGLHASWYDMACYNFMWSSCIITRCDKARYDKKACKYEYECMYDRQDI